jgi:lysylphosphatidylglycerol synthetase-like protein (DUF2156 family)
MKALAGILVVVFIILAGVAFAHPLEPSPLTKALGFANDKPHAKHAIAYFVLALLSLVWIRFQSNAAKT